MNNAIQDVNINACKLCEKLTKELGPMETEREHRINNIIIEMARELVVCGRFITEKQNLEKLLLAGEFDVETFE